MAAPPPIRGFNGATFERVAPSTETIDGFESPFTFFYVDTEGSLTLRDITLRNGLIYIGLDYELEPPVGGYKPTGSAILNLGEVQLWNSTLSGNQAARPPVLPILIFFNLIVIAMRFITQGS